MLARQSRGDTIVEVILAFAIFSLVAVSTIAVMNRGIAIAERSLEVTLVRQQIDAQAELLRYASAIDNAAWQSIKISALPTLPTIDRSTCASAAPLNSFIVSADTSSSPAEIRYYSLTGGSSPFVEATMHSQFDMTTSGGPPQVAGIWVVPVTVSGGSATASEAYDMHIGTCWYTPDADRPVTLGTIVRIYESI